MPWLFERLKSENELAGVPLIQNPDEDQAAVAASSSGADSQDSQPSTDTKDSLSPPVDEPSCAQGTVDLGFKCVWVFPARGTWAAGRPR